MSVSTGRRKFVLAAAAVVAAAMLYGMVRGGGPIAVGYHGSPALPSYVTTIDAGGFPGALADGLDATWVPVAQYDPVGGSYTPKLARIAADGTVTHYPLPTFAFDVAVGTNAIWLTGTGQAASVLRVNPATQQVESFPVGTNVQVGEIVIGPDGNAWFIYLDYGSGTGGTYGVATIDNAGVVTRYPLPNRSLNELVLAEGALWFLEDVFTGSVFGSNVARLNISGTTATVGPEYFLENAFARGLVNGPGNALWFIEQTFGGDDSITQLPITGPTAGTPVRHPIGAGTFTAGYAFDLAAGSDGALWFTTASGGNLGRMTVAGSVSYLCVGPGHPFFITSGPGGNVTFVTSEYVARVPVTASGSPCPAPPTPPRPPGPPGPAPRGGGTAAPPVVTADKTPAKISLSGAKSQRFKGTVSVSVQCNEACRATGQATVSTGASKVFRSSKATKQLAAGKRVKLTVKFGKKAVKGIKRALRRKKLTAKVTIVSRDSAGNGSTAKRNVKLKR